MRRLFTDDHKVSLGKGAVADGTAETTSAVVDMAGFDEVTFLVALGDVDAAAVLTLTAKENTANSVSSPTPTAIPITSTSLGTLTSGAAVITESSGNLDNKIIAITVARSSITKRYVFLSITVADESYEIVAILTVQGMPRTLPITQHADVVAVAHGVS